MEAILSWKTVKIFFEPLPGILGAPLRLKASTAAVATASLSSASLPSLSAAALSSTSL